MPLTEPTTPPSKPLRISLIIPALNEEDVIHNTLQEVLAQVEVHCAEYEIILVNDGSQDSTGEIMDGIAAKNPSIHVLHNSSNQGLGISYKRGVQVAKFEYVMMLCGDGGLPAESLPLIFKAVDMADIVVPYMENLKTIKSPFRYLLSRTYTKLLNLIFWKNIRYYNGLHVHRLALLRQIDITSSGFAFQAEILIKLLKGGCSYVEVGVVGAENTRRSNAVKMKNLINICRTMSLLILEILFFSSNRIIREPSVQGSDKNWQDAHPEKQAVSGAS